MRKKFFLTMQTDPLELIHKNYKLSLPEHIATGAQYNTREIQKIKIKE